MYMEDVEHALEAAALRICGTNNDAKALPLLMASLDLTGAMVEVVEGLNGAGRSIEVTPALGADAVTRIQAAQTSKALLSIIADLTAKANAFHP
jgi:hypothetical protein